MTPASNKVNLAFHFIVPRLPLVLSRARSHSTLADNKSTIDDTLTNDRIHEFLINPPGLY